MTKTSLPRNFRNNLHAYTMDQLATALDIVHERAVAAHPASTGCTRAMNLAAEINDEAFRRSFRFVLCGDGFSFERFGEGAMKFTEEHIGREVECGHGLRRKLVAIIESENLIGVQYSTTGGGSVTYYEPPQYWKFA